MTLEIQPELDLEVEHEFEIPCGLDPRRGCQRECFLQDLMKNHFRGEVTRSGISLPHLIETLRDPGNEEILENFRRQQSEDHILRRVRRFCKFYPQADITYNPGQENTRTYTDWIRKLWIKFGHQ